MVHHMWNIHPTKLIGLWVYRLEFSIVKVKLNHCGFKTVINTNFEVETNLINWKKEQISRVQKIKNFSEILAHQYLEILLSTLLSTPHKPYDFSLSFYKLKLLFVEQFVTVVPSCLTVSPPTTIGYQEYLRRTTHSSWFCV